MYVVIYNITVIVKTEMLVSDRCVPIILYFERMIIRARFKNDDFILSLILGPPFQIIIDRHLATKLSIKSNSVSNPLANKNSLAASSRSIRLGVSVVRCRFTT